MNKKFKKIMSVILCAVMLFTTASVAFAAEDGRKVIDSGFCGAEGENLTWTLYDDGELVISGEGEMDWYFVEHESEGKETVRSAPWSKYYETIKVITVEDGVTSIGNDAFVSKSINYNKINIPLSLEFFEGSMFTLIKAYQVKGKHIAFCYVGTESEWDAVECKYYNIEFDEKSNDYKRTLLSTSSGNRIEYNGYEDFLKMYFNGEEPSIFCEIERTTSTVAVNPFEKVELYAHYYSEESDGTKLIWSIDGDGIMLQENTAANMQTDISLFVYGDVSVKLELVSATGEILDCDEISIKSSLPQDTSFFGLIERFFIQIFLMIYIFVTGVVGGAAGSLIGFYA